MRSQKGPEVDGSRGFKINGANKMTNAHSHLVKSLTRINKVF